MRLFNRRRDLDNIASAHKYVQDALVKAGVLQGDGWKCVAGFSDRFEVDKVSPRVEVEIEEVRVCPVLCSGGKL